MKYFRHLIAIAVAAACACGARAGDVTREMALAAADAWMAANPSFGTTGPAVSATAEYDGSVLMWWMVATSGGGAIFVAPDTSIEPVLAAVPSCTGTLPAGHPLRALLSADVTSRLAANAAATAVPSGRPGRLMAGASASSSSANITNEAIAAAVSAAECRWAKYVSGKGGRLRLGATPSNVIAVVPGFGDEDGNDYLRFWNQSHPFNLYTPENSVCGCVATAGAAILQYFGATGLTVNVTRDCKYNDESIQLTTISATNHYDWSMLPQEMGGQNTDPSYDEEAVEATLGRAAYDVGVCVGMSYSQRESGATIKNLAKALREDFDFSSARYIEIGTNNDFTAIYEDLCRTNPVVLGIRKSLGFSAHAVLAVGYGKDDEDVSYTRVFMGWGGADDAWYNLPEVEEYDSVSDAIVSIMLDPPIGHKTIEAARAAAMENHKPLLLISGTVGETNTTALLDNIEASGLADEFEIYFASYASDPYADQNPSYGIFNPLAFNRDTDNRWAFYNGRLAYCAGTNAVDATILTATLEGGLDDWDAAYENYLHLLEASSNGVIVSTANSVNLFYDELWDTVIGVSDDSYDYDIFIGDSSDYGMTYYMRNKDMKGELYENVFTNGQTVVLESPSSVITNMYQGIVWECTGWLLETVDDDGYEIEDYGAGTVATFTVESNSYYEVRWLWDPSAVRLTTEAQSPGGRVSPNGEGWYPYGETVTVTATPASDARNFQFSYWSGDTDGCTASGASIEVPMDMPRGLIKANFLRAGGGSVLSIASDPADVKPGVACSPHGYMLAYGENRVAAGDYSIYVPDAWEDATGGVWRCTGWTVTGCVETNGTETVAEFALTGDAALTWQWEYAGGGEPVIPDPAEAPIGPVEGGVTNSAIVIYSTNDVQLAVQTRVSNATAGYWYSIWSADTVDGPYSYVTGQFTGEAKCKVEEPVPDILSLVIVFDPADSAKFYRVVVTEEEPED